MGRGGGSAKKVAFEWPLKNQLKVSYSKFGGIPDTSLRVARFKKMVVKILNPKISLFFDETNFSFTTKYLQSPN
jgi:hypothetical protein